MLIRRRTAPPTRSRCYPPMLLALVLLTSPSQADIQLGLGVTRESTAALTLTLDTLLPIRRHPRLELRLATGLLLLSSRARDGNAAWLLMPALRYTAAGSTRWFVEGGIGAALFLDTHVESRRLATAFQFHDRLAVGRRLGDGELLLSLSHYSNAGIKSPNDGLESLTLGYRWAW